MKRKRIEDFELYQGGGQEGDSNLLPTEHPDVASSGDKPANSFDTGGDGSNTFNTFTGSDIQLLSHPLKSSV